MKVTTATFPSELIRHYPMAHVGQRLWRDEFLIARVTPEALNYALNPRLSA